MIRLITRGRFTRDYAQALLAAPEDREPAVRKLIEGAGGKLINFYFTTGDADFLIVAETNEAESLIAALLATAAAGMISDVSPRQGLGPQGNLKRSPKRLPKQQACTARLARADSEGQADSHDGCMANVRYLQKRTFVVR